MAAKEINVTVEIAPSISAETLREMVDKVITSELKKRNIRVTEHNTVEEALRGR
jgi:hypothetical protein